MTAQPGQDDTEANPQTAAPTSADRLLLYRYLTADSAGDYLALMRLFTGTLLTDLSAAEAHAALETDGNSLTLEETEARCQQLEKWGNLVPSVRDARVATISEYLRSRSRYQVSKLGGRVHRQVDDILTAQDGAREVARELLGSTATTLARIADAAERLGHHPRSTGTGVDGGVDVETLAAERLGHHPRSTGTGVDGGVDVETLAADVTTVFNNQRLFADSAADFYAFVQARIARYDLAGEEFAAFKTMLLDYVELISADVNRHAPLIATLLARIDAHQDALLAALDTLPGPVVTGEHVERSPGRTREDWAALHGWYTGGRGRSGPDQLRGAAEQALGQLLTNAKRMLAAAGTGVSRRADLLRLAAWFETADDQTCHRLYDAAFGTYPARHLLGGPEEDDGRAGPTTSWWDADPVDVPLSLRERGDRSARGRTARVPDPGLDRERLLAEAEAEANHLRAAAAELAAVGDLDGAHISPAARQLLLDRLADLLSREQTLTGTASSLDTDTGLELTATVTPGTHTVVHGPDGNLTVDDLTLSTRRATGTRAAGTADDTGYGEEYTA